MGIRNKTKFYHLSMFPVLLAQLAACMATALIIWLAFGLVAGYSALLGGMIAWLANGYFTYKAFKYSGARSTAAIVQSLWAGQFGKMVLTAVFFALVFLAVKPLAVVAVFVGYIVVQMTSFIALILKK